MLTLNELLIIRFKGMYKRLHADDPVELENHIALMIPEFTILIKKISIIVLDNFLQGMREQMIDLIRLEFDRAVESTLNDMEIQPEELKNIDQFGFLAITFKDTFTCVRDKLHTIIYHFYLDKVLKPLEIYCISSLSQDSEMNMFGQEIEIASSKTQLLAEFLGSKFTELSETGGLPGIDAFISRFIDSIVKRVNIGLLEMPCLSLCRDVTRGQNEIRYNIDNITALNALFILNEFELSLIQKNSESSNKTSYKEFSAKMPSDYYNVFSMRIKDPKLLFVIDPVFVNECNLACTNAVPQMPALVDVNSTPSSLSSTPETSPRIESYQQKRMRL